MTFNNNRVWLARWLVKITKMRLLLVSLGLLVPFCVALSVPEVKLHNAAKSGLTIPAVGLGTGAYVYVSNTIPGEVWNDTVAEQAVGEWIKLGGRRIDASLSYRNQKGVGKAIKECGVPRDQLFIVSKVGSGGLVSGSGMGYNETMNQMGPILETLGVDYLDLLLIHWPGPPGNSTDPACQGNPTSWRACRQSTWRAIQDIFRSGKARAIGTSNFEKNHLEDILVMKELLPAINQIEFSPYWHEDDLVSFCKSQNIQVNGYAPLACPDWAPSSHNWLMSLLQDPTIDKIAKSHKCSPAQVILSWEWKQNIVVNPRTYDQDHMMENLKFFDISLSSDEMNALATLKKPSNPKVCPDPHQLK